MTPKEKAKELFLKYAMYIRAGYMFDEEADEDAKQCALIAVDEIIKIQWFHSEPTCFDDLANEYKEKSVYWNEVKSELEKL